VSFIGFRRSRKKDPKDWVDFSHYPMRVQHAGQSRLAWGALGKRCPISRIGKSSRASRASSLVAGTAKHYPNAKQQLTFAGKAQTVAQVTAKLQSIVDLRNDTEAAQATAKAKVSAENEQLPALLAFLMAYVAFIRATFGNAPDTLADFGVPPKKAPTPLTATQQAAAVAKRASTREARGTRGSQQKKLVKGNVTGVVVTPVTAPAPASQPAAAAAPTGSSNGSGTTPHAS
jgi:hypothetical protein